MKRRRVLIIDDSATMRAIIAERLGSDPSIDVVGMAADAMEADRLIGELNPDVVTLDIVMPQVNGLEYLKKLLRQRPLPVIMVSSLTQAWAKVSVEALEAGAFDFVCKPDLDGLVEKVKAAAQVRSMSLGRRTRVSALRPDYRPANKLIAIGASTGGVDALRTILAGFPANCPPTVVVQHMPAAFAASFAARLDSLCPAHVQEAKDGQTLEPGNVYVAPGGDTHLEVHGGHPWRAVLRKGPPVNGHCPSVDALFESVATAAGRRGVGVILTGMGRDGAKGLAAMRMAGARTLGQDEATSVVYGMPKAAHDIGGVERQLPLGAIGVAALDLCRLEMRGVA